MSEVLEPPPPRPGFRLSSSDAAVLVVAAGAAIWLSSSAPIAAVVVATVVGHFFLFCNVVRVPTRLELCWAATFVVNVLAWQLAGRLTATAMLAVQLPITAVVVALTLRRADYHGVGWRAVRRRRGG